MSSSRTSQFKHRPLIKWWLGLVLLASILTSSLLTTASAQKVTKAQKQAFNRAVEVARQQWPNMSDTALKIIVSYLSANRLYDDPKLAAYVQELGEKMVAVSEHAGKPYVFLLVDNEIPNASTPGHGVVFVHRGLLTLLHSEAQLAGVLGHEVGHVVGRHNERLKSNTVGSNILATAASILTGSNAVGSAIATQKAVDRVGFGRELELEADGFAADYLYEANYEPMEMMAALASMADFQRLHAGEDLAAYHGLGRTHPRDDIRRRRAIRAAGERPPGEAELGRARYREMISNLVHGPNVRPTAPPGYVRYNNERLGITFLHPDNWNRTVKGSKIIVKDPQNTLQFKIEIERTADRTQSSGDAIKQRYPDDLTGVAKIDPKATRDLGVVGLRPNQRVALIKVARNTFHFQGLARDNTLSKARDDVFLGMIASFRRLHPNDKNLTELKRLYFEQLKPGETFTSIAIDNKDENIADENELRVLNGYYPKGEAEPGTWIKKVRMVPVEQNTRIAETAEGRQADQEAPEE